jgi:hypothetical protein
MATSIEFPTEELPNPEISISGCGGRNWTDQWSAFASLLLCGLARLADSDFICAITSQGENGGSYGHFLWRELNTHSKPITICDDDGGLAFHK